MANIRDVAKAAGVSIATVSAALNKSASVSDATRRRVWAAADAVGYAPNAIARSLRLGKSRLIGVVIADITNPFCADLVRIIEKEAISKGYSIIVCNTDEDEKRSREILDQLRQQQVAGIIMTPAADTKEYAAFLEGRTHPPMVTIDQQVHGLARDYLGVDNRAAARMLVEYLLRLGHRRIAFITGAAGLWTAEERLAAAQEAVKEAGGDLDDDLFVHAAYRSDAGYAAAVKLLTHGHRPTAIVGGNNVIALGALQALLDLGFRCPQDISVAGIDDVPWGGLVRPRVTTVAQPVEEMARRAIQWLLERIGDGAAQPPRTLIFRPAFLSGDSCTPPMVNGADQATAANEEIALPGEA